MTQAVSTTEREQISPALRVRLGNDLSAPAEAIEELQRRGGSLAPSTIRTQVTSRMCHYAPAHHTKVFDDLERVGPGLYRARREG